MVRADPAKVRSKFDRSNRAWRLGTKTKPWAAAYLGNVDGYVDVGESGYPDADESMVELFGNYQSEDEDPFNDDGNDGGLEEAPPPTVILHPMITVSDEGRTQIARKRALAVEAKRQKEEAKATLKEHVQKKRRIALEKRARLDIGRMTEGQLAELRGDRPEGPSEPQLVRSTESDPRASSSTDVVCTVAPPPADDARRGTCRKQEGDHGSVKAKKRRVAPLWGTAWGKNVSDSAKWKVGARFKDDLGKLAATVIAKERSALLSLCKTASTTVEHASGYDDKPVGERPWDEDDEGEAPDGDQEDGDENQVNTEEAVILNLVAEPAQPIYTSEMSTDALKDLLEMESMGLMVAWPRGIDPRVAKSIILSREA